MVRKYLYEHQEKMKIQNSHWKRVEMAFKITETPLNGQKKFFKVCLVGTLNLCLKDAKD